MAAALVDTGKALHDSDGSHSYQRDSAAAVVEELAGSHSPQSEDVLVVVVAVLAGSHSPQPEVEAEVVVVVVVVLLAVHGSHSSQVVLAVSRAW